MAGNWMENISQMKRIIICRWISVSMNFAIITPNGHSGNSASGSVRVKMQHYCNTAYQFAVPSWQQWNFSKIQNVRKTFYLKFELNFVKFLLVLFLNFNYDSLILIENIKFFPLNLFLNHHISKKNIPCSHEYISITECVIDALLERKQTLIITLVLFT